MSLKSFIVSGVMGVGFIGFIVGVPSPQVVYQNFGSGVPNPTVGYFGACSDKNSGCNDNQADAIYHCSKGDNNFDYLNVDKFPFIAVGSTSTIADQNFCQRVVAAEAFGILAIIFSFASVWAAFFHKYTHRHAGATSAFLAALFGIIALGVFFGGTWQANDTNNTVAQDVNSNNLKLGYSAILQIIGVICSFFGSLLSVVASKF